jgi:predicted RNase H-like nuclease (RuvC/YqgF family)
VGGEGGRVNDTLKTLAPWGVTIVAVLSIILTYRTGRAANLISTKRISIDKYGLLDAKQEQIAEWGFKAADEANQRADRITAEAQAQVASLQEQLNELRCKLEEQVAAMAAVRSEHANEMAALRDQHTRDIDERNRRIYALEDALVNVKARVTELERGQ